MGFLFCGFTMAIDVLMYLSARDPARVVEGVCPTWLLGADGLDCGLPYVVHQLLSLGPHTVTVSGAAGHNRGKVAETPLPARTQSMTADCTFNFPPPRTVAGWFFSASCVF